MKGIYKITNIINNKCYVGKSIDIIKRFKEHKYKLKTNTHPNQHLQIAWNKYGESAFTFSVIEVVEFDELLNDLEIHYIETLDTLKNGYNMTNGGDGVGSGDGNPNYNQTLYTFFHYSGLIEENITFLNFIKKYKLTRYSVSKLLKKDNKIYCGWATTLEAFNIPKYIKRTWYNIDGRIEVDLCAREMYDKYGKIEFVVLCSNNSKFKTRAGWSIVNKTVTLYDCFGNSYNNLNRQQLIQLIQTREPNVSLHSIKTRISRIMSGKANMISGLRLDPTKFKP